MHGIARGDTELFRKRSVAIHANSLGIATNMASPREAVATFATDDVAFAIDEIAFLVALRIRTDFLDGADKFMAYDHGRFDRFLRPVVPIVDMDIRATDRRLLDLDQHFIVAGCRHRHIS